MAKTLTNTSNTKPSFWTWIHLNRIKIALVLFLVVVPLTLSLIIYTGTYANGQRVHFDAEATQSTTFINDFVAIDEIDALELSIEWTELKNPTEDDQGMLTGGYYRFNILYTPKENYEIISVAITPVLKTPWTERQVLGTRSTVTTTNRSFTILYNEDLPLRPLWFVTVDEPNLYLKVEYTFITASNQVTKTVYVSFPLHDLNPDKVVS
ncbi:MAG: hypothetical protein C4537_05670 [Acholeplasma sp.]|jgi:hypothetical protein|nr:MAG: hypothetical protein C4537_05670 [Acholeplasma sp.]